MSAAMKIPSTPAEIMEAEMIYAISGAIEDHPRSRQRALGPSEVGEPCTRYLLHKLHGDESPAIRSIPWLPTVGTAMHTWLAEVFGKDADYLVEHRVCVGEIDGQEVWGNSDLFHRPSGFVVDHKIIGKTPMTEYRRRMLPKYRIQAHLYGRGFLRAGYDVRHVMVACFPRNEVSLDSRFFWSEEFDESVAIAALDRCTGLVRLMKAVGIETALALYAPCTDNRYCPYCYTPPVNRPFVASGTAALFAAATRKD